jgi:hypothetical protein
MITDTRYSATGFTIGQTLLRPKGAPDNTVMSTVGTRRAQALPSQIISAQAKTIGTLKGARTNPLADVANWKTGGRKTAFGAMGTMGDGNMSWWYIGGAVLLVAVLMRRKK